LALSWLLIQAVHDMAMVTAPLAVALAVTAALALEMAAASETTTTQWHPMQ